jgi:hypothetical protein
MMTSRILACYQTRKTPDFAPTQQFAMDRREVLLQRLRCGQRVEVLSLCLGESREEEHQQREEEYRRIFVG